MLDWLSRSGKNHTMPEYSRAREMPSRGVPSRCSEQEANEAFSARCDSIQRWLCESPRRPQDDSPLFVEILTGNAQSILTIERAKDTRCMPVFSSPFRAAEAKIETYLFNCVRGRKEIKRTGPQILMSIATS